MLPMLDGHRWPDPQMNPESPPTRPSLWRRRVAGTAQLQDEQILVRAEVNGSRPLGQSSAVDRRRRVLNVLVAGVGVLVLAPLMVLISIAIKLTSRGPILFRQDRIGLDRRGTDRTRLAEGSRDRNRGGRVFTIYKFRTMRVLKEGEIDQVWATPDDPLITLVGRAFRRYRLDELPQLFNVLRGDMNVLGPRPEQPEIFEQLRPDVDRFAERQRVLPGITGWAQVNHGYDQCLDDVRRKVGLDLEYIRHCSPAEDLRIMARTLPVMVKKKGGH